MDGRIGNVAALGPGLATLFNRNDRAQVAHVRLGGLDHGGKSDSVEPARGSRLLAAAAQFRQSAVALGHGDRRLVIAGIDQRTGRRPIWERARRNEVLADHIERVEAQLDGDAMHQPFEPEIDLRAAKAAHHAGRRLVGHHQLVGDAHILHGICAGHDAMLTIKRSRHRRAQIGAVIVNLLETKGGHSAVVRHGGLGADDAVRRGYRRGEMLETILHPFDRPTGTLRGDAHQDDIRKDRLLDAEAAAGIGRRSDSQLRALATQRLRHHRVNREWTLKIAENVVDALAGLVVGHNDIALERRLRVARVVDSERHYAVGFGEFRVRISIGEMAVGRYIRSDRGMHQRRVLLQRG